MGDTGREHPLLAPPKTPVSARGGAESDARDAPEPVDNPDLATLMAAWPQLPPHIRAAIKALVVANSQSPGEDE